MCLINRTYVNFFQIWLVAVASLSPVLALCQRSVERLQEVLAGGITACSSGFPVTEGLLLKSELIHVFREKIYRRY